MTVRHCIVRDCYRDSVSLLALSATLSAREGVLGASVTMATPANVDAARESGLDGPVDASPSDVLVLVTATTEAVADEALEAAVTALLRPAGGAGAGTDDAGAGPAHSLRQALGEAWPAESEPSVALVSVPGPFAAAEARKALDAGLHVMIFSDNVDVAHERALKELGRERGLLVMGPDCGTCVLDGIPLGFANVVRPGPVGLVGASGTGLQEVATQLHRLGSGASQVIGTGGRDLGAAVGGLTTESALALLADDPRTEVIVVVSKPADPATARRVLARAAATGKPVVAALLGAEPAAAVEHGVVPAATLDEAARLAASLAGSPVPATPAPAPAGTRSVRSGGILRGLFSGGTLCYEAQLVLAGYGVTVRSNAPAPGQLRLDASAGASAAHTLVDLGADEYTQGRPHPMIDPGTRDAAVAAALDEDGVSVVLLDVVLGHGGSADPVGGLLAVLGARTGGPQVVAHVCGTDDDPVPRGGVVAALTSAGVEVAGSNAEAARRVAVLLGVVGEGS
jgi:succinyl-CoA synthetase alpha subunit